MKLDLYRRSDGALVVVPTRFAPEVPVLAPAGLRYIRTVERGLLALGDELVLEIGLHGYAVAQGADEALLRSCPEVEADIVSDVARNDA